MSHRDALLVLERIQDTLPPLLHFGSLPIVILFPSLHEARFAAKQKNQTQLKERQTVSVMLTDCLKISHTVLDIVKCLQVVVAAASYKATKSLHPTGV
jgi:hypothetical protein